MLKHATISRTSRAQQTLQFQRHCQQQQQQQQQLGLVGRAQRPDLTLDSEATEQQQQCAHQQVDLFNDGRGDLHQDQAISSGIDDHSDASPTPNALADQSATSMLFAPSSLLNPSQTKRQLLHREPSSCCSSPTPSNQIMTNSMQFTTAAGYNYYHTPATSRSTPSSLSNSPMKLTSRHHHHHHHHHHHQLSTRLAATPTSTSTITTTTSTSKASSADSMIKIFAQTLSQDVEYITLHVNAQTKSQQIIKSLLKKFRLKHRDPNLFYLTLERWIRKDGLKFKSVMLLGDEACPLQLQQCCSNPPHNDIKFTLQMRTGALVKIYCSDVVPDAKYKCLSLSTQTTVDETIELMLHCLNLTTSQNKNSNQSTPTPTTAHNNTNTNNSNNNTHHRLTSSPNLCSGSCSSSSSSSSSDTSSSSGIESEPTSNNNNQNRCQAQTGALDSDSRASSVTSISSSSNVSSLSSSLIDQYCMIIECIDSNFKRILHPDEYLVDVYQGLLAEASKTDSSSRNSSSNEHSIGGPISPLTNHNSSPPGADPIKQNPDQWFFIKLKRRYEVKSNNNNNNENHHAATISFVNPRQNVPLPPIPSSLFKHHHHHQNNHRANNYNSLRHIVSTTQIEINSNGIGNSGGGGGSHTLGRATSRPACSSDESELMREIMRSTPITVSQSQVGAKDCVDSGGGGQSQAPPSIILLTPPIRPRRRNLSNASSTFGRPLMANNRRRYDPAQLAEDLNRLNIVGVAPVAESE